MKLKKIDHIGIAVKDLDAAKRFYAQALGVTVDREEALADMRIAFIRVGDVNLELIQSTTEGGGAIAHFIGKRGEGVHHIAYEVDDVSAALEELKAQGVGLVDEAPRDGAGGKKIAFVHPKSAHGVLTELVCKSGK